MGCDLIRPKKESRSGGALPEAGRKGGRGKGGTPTAYRIAAMGTRSRRFLRLLALSLFLLPATAAWSGNVVGVIDGDSITVLHDGKGEQIRLWGIDCPKKNQDFGTKAKYVTSILTIVFRLPFLSSHLQLSSADHPGRLCLTT